MDIIEKLKEADHALTVTELSALLQVHSKTIQRWAKKGSIPSIRLGGEAGAGEWRFNPNEVAKFLGKHNHLPKGGK
jgi:excisionase family DNA binding protein